jgi:hypothetical protein
MSPSNSKSKAPRSFHSHTELSLCAKPGMSIDNILAHVDAADFLYYGMTL